MELENNLCEEENNTSLCNNSLTVKRRLVKIDSGSQDLSSNRNTTENVSPIKASENSNSIEGPSTDEINDNSSKLKNFKTVRKRFAVVDSDSDDELLVPLPSHKSGEDERVTEENSVEGPSSDEINDNSSTFKIDKNVRRRLAVVDSDSDDELLVPSPSHKGGDERVTEKNSVEGPSIDEINDNSSTFKIDKNGRRRLAVVDSESDDEFSVPSSSHKSGDDERITEEIASTIERGSKTKKLTVADNDSDSESQTIETNTNDAVANNQVIYEFNKNGKLVSESNSETWAGQKSLGRLCDSESSEDEENRRFSPESVLTNETHSRSLAKTKSRKTVQRAPKEKKMTTKQALAQRQEICSESQRMLRESRVSLPYHRPKTYSIKEFLQKRSRFASTLTETKVGHSPSVAMKMSYQQLEIMSKRLEEREKEVKKFYESDNESDESAAIDNEGMVEDQGDNNDNEEVLDQQNNIEKEENGIELNQNVVDETVNTVDEVEQSEITEQHHIGVESGNFNIEMEVTLQENNTNIDEKIKADDQVDKMEDEIFLSNNRTIENEKLDKEERQSGVNQEEMDVQENIQDSIIQEETTNLDNLNDYEENVIISEKQNASDWGTKKINFLNLTEEEKSQETFTVKFDNTETNINESRAGEQRNSSEVEQENNPKVLDNSGNSIEYDFNLDDFEDDSQSLSVTKPLDTLESRQQNVEEEYLLRLIKKYDSAPMDETSTANDTKISRMALLKEKLGSTIPRLTVDPGQEIDLEEDVVKASGINRLMERFLKHTAKNTVMKDKVQLTMTNFSQGEITTETVTMSVEPEEPVAFLEKPGIRLKMLKNELQIQMAQRRSELWKQKNLLSDEIERVENEDGEKSDYEADIDEEEAEMTDEETTDDEEHEDILNDQYTENVDKIKSKHEFLDEEADESDINEVDDAESDANEADNVESDTNEVDEAESDANEVDGESKIECKVQDNLSNRTSKRTLVCYPAVSDDSVDGTETTQFSVVAGNGSLNTTDSVDEDLLPPNLPTSDKTPIKSKSQFSFLTPVHHLTGLQSLNSGSKFLNESPVSAVTVQAEPSPFKDKEWSTELQKKLFIDSQNSIDTQYNLEDVEYVPIKPIYSSNELDSFVTTEASQTNTQDLMDVCSGSFSTCLEASKEESEDTKCVQSLNKRENMTQINLDLTEEVKNLEDDELISQLLNEEELEQFKQKFVSPLINAKDANLKSGRLVLDSSDEEDDAKAEMKKKPQKKLNFSDDESESEIEETEEIELHDDLSDGEAEIETSNRTIEYDSEENEIEIRADKVKEVKSREFFENEAELSESEWGSEDEDEKELDVLEAEQGDADVFDENEVRNDLEKIHMRQVLDQDNKEIKMLQELLLEDGEFHGTGRQRQFKWRNIDADGTEEGKNEDVDTYLDEEESEEQWRKARHEREMFLKKKHDSQDVVENDELVSSESNSQVLKLGQEALRRSFSTIEKPKAASCDKVKKPFTILNTRGSFLARNDKFLTKFAELNKAATSVTVGTSKKTKIVFETFTAEEVQNDNSLNGKKRKGNDGTPKIIKKLRLSSNISPNVKNINRKKQLF